MDDIRQQLRENSNKFILSIRRHIRKAGLAHRTEQTYIHWIKRFIHFHMLRNLRETGIV